MRGGRAAIKPEVSVISAMTYALHLAVDGVYVPVIDGLAEGPATRLDSQPVRNDGADRM